MEYDVDKIDNTFNAEDKYGKQKQKGEITVVGANYVFFAFALIYIVSQFLLFIPVIIFGPDFLERNLYGLLLVNQYIIILVPVIFYSLKAKLNIKEVFRLRSPGLVPAAIIVLMALPAYFTAVMLNSIVLYILQFIGKIPTQQIPVPKTLGELAIGILIVAVSPGICEELLHRGIMLRAYEKRGTIKAIIITSIYFGFFHFDITNLVGPIFLGLLIAYYVVRTNSIFAGMLAHFLNNAISEIFQYLYRNQPQAESFEFSQTDLLRVILLGLVALGILYALFNLFKRVTMGRYVYKPSISKPINDIVAIVTHWPIICIFVLYVFMTGLFILQLVFQ